MLKLQAALSSAHSVHRKSLLELEGGFNIKGKQEMKWNVALDSKTLRLYLPKWWVASWNLMFLNQCLTILLRLSFPLPYSD